MGGRTIRFRVNRTDYEASVLEEPVTRAELSAFQVVVEHPSESYAIFVGSAGFVARPIAIAEVAA